MEVVALAEISLVVIVASAEDAEDAVPVEAAADVDLAVAVAVGHALGSVIPQMASGSNGAMIGIWCSSQELDIVSMASWAVSRVARKPALFR